MRRIFRATASRVHYPIFKNKTKYAPCKLADGNDTKKYKHVINLYFCTKKKALKSFSDSKPSLFLYSVSTTS